VKNTHQLDSTENYLTIKGTSIIGYVLLMDTPIPCGQSIFNLTGIMVGKGRDSFLIGYHFNAILSKFEIIVIDHCNQATHQNCNHIMVDIATSLKSVHFLT
jgi:hypothetical protein